MSFLIAYLITPSMDFVVGSCSPLEAFCGMTGFQIAVFSYSVALMWCVVFLYLSVIDDFDSHLKNREMIGND